MTFTLSEASSDFTINDVTVVGGTLSNFQGSGTSYTATFTPNANVTSAANGGTTATAVQNYGIDPNVTPVDPVDPVPPPTLKTTVTIDAITGDNLINASELASINTTVGGKVTGAFKAGDKVTLTLNGKDYVTSVDANGAYSVSVLTADLQNDPDTKIEASVTGTGGSFASAAQDYVIDSGSTPSKTTLSINPVTADNIINASEAAASTIAVTGKVGGAYKAGDTVTLSINGKTYDTTVAADGSFTRAVPTADLLADKDSTIDGTVTGTGGTAASAIQNYGIDTTPVNPATGALDAASDTGTKGDNTTNDRTPDLSGTVPAGSTATVTINGLTYPVTVKPDGTWSFTQPTNLPDGTYYPVLNVTTNGVTQPTNITPFTVDATAPSFTQPTNLPDGTYTPVINVITNGQTTSTPVTPFTIDTQAPTVAITSPVTTLAAGQSATLTFTVSEATNNLTDADIQVTGGTLSALMQSATNPLVYTATFTAAVGATSASVKIDSNKFSDAAGNNNQDGAEANNTWSYTVNTPNTDSLTALTIEPITGDNVLSATEQGQTSITVKGQVTGKFAAGDVVTLVVGGQSINATVGADGSYVANVPVSAFKADADLKIEGSVKGTGGDTATAAQTYTLENTDTPVKTALAIDPITADNIIGVSEATGEITVTGKVSGKFSAGDTVTGTGGTTANAVQDYAVNPDIKPDPSLKTALYIDPISSNTDNLLSLTEQTNPLTTVTGFVSGTYATGDQVNLSLNGTSYTATVKADGTWAVDVSTADLKADPDTKIEGTIAGTGGSLASAEQDYQVETNNNTGKVTALSIDPVTEDNVVGSLESDGLLAITGQVTGEFTINDTVTLTVNGQTFTGKPDDLGFFSIDVPAIDLLADPDTTVDGTVTGTGGTTATAIQDYGVDPHINPALDGPSISVSRTSTGDVGAAETIVFTLSEASSDFALADITITDKNGLSLADKLSNFTKISDTQYSAVFTSTGVTPGNVTIGVKAGTFSSAGQFNQDTYENPAPAGTAYQADNAVVLNVPFFRDGNKTPTVQVLRAGTTDLSAGQSETITFILSEPSTDFTAQDIDVSAGTLSGFTAVAGSNGTVYTATYTPATNAKGVVTIGVQSGKFSNANAVFNEDTYLSNVANATQQTDNAVSFGFDTTGAPETDTTAPTIAVKRLGSGTLSTSETIEFTVSEATKDFTLADITVNGGTLSNFTAVPTSGSEGTGYTTYVATFTPAANSTGIATIGVKAGKFSDAAGNLNQDTYDSADSFSGKVVETDNKVDISYNTQTSPTPSEDTTAPTIAVERATDATLQSGGTETLTFTLSEPSLTFGATITYKVYDHSTTQAQVLVDIDVTVDTASPVKITAISTDAGASALDFVTNDPTLVYTGKVSLK